MDVKELRIGNLLLKNNEIVEVRGFTFMGKHGTNIRIKTKWHSEVKFEPIPLTEEWLVKFGFNKDRLGYIYIDIDSNMFLGYDKNHGVCLFDIDDNEIVWIKHVHQLQNLYHSLTGEELCLR